MTTTMDVTTELTVLTCWCGMPHAVPSSLREYQMRKFNANDPVPDIYCPLGHAHVPSGKSKLDIEREKRAAVEMQLANRTDDLRVERQLHAATKTKLTKQTRRITNGVCPECKRSFKQLTRHMQSQHPECIT